MRVTAIPMNMWFAGLEVIIPVIEILSPEDITMIALN
jgi:hypothetical protein